jgi:hypothetical protein
MTRQDLPSTRRRLAYTFGGETQAKWPTCEQLLRKPRLQTKFYSFTRLVP